METTYNTTVNEVTYVTGTGRATDEERRATP